MVEGHFSDDVASDGFWWGPFHGGGAGAGAVGLPWWSWEVGGAKQRSAVHFEVCVKVKPQVTLVFRLQHNTTRVRNRQM